ncbi:MAG: MGMT family protein [Treponema sp.]|jgi:methylated-DNA-protein-cysteine methyltransferase-like protein|nr:MGMT family protein [Treponema sp.]
MAAIRSVPPGKVSSYGAVALAAGLRNGGRQTARILHTMAGPHHLPWHRIVRAGGSIALEPGRGREEQIRLLRAEGVSVSRAGTVDMAVYGVMPVAVIRNDT